MGYQAIWIQKPNTKTPTVFLLVILCKPEYKNADFKMKYIMSNVFLLMYRKSL